MSDFCEPETTTSTPHSSWGRSTAPSPEIASTQSTESWARTTSFRARMSLTTPVEVSDWVTKTARGLRSSREIAGIEALGVDSLAPLELDVGGGGVA